MVYGFVNDEEYGVIYNEYPTGHAYASHRNGKITRQGNSDRFDHPSGLYSTRISTKNSSDGYVSAEQLKLAAKNFDNLIGRLDELNLLVLDEGLTHNTSSLLRVVQEGHMGRMMRVELNVDSLGDGLNSNLALFSFHLQKGTIFNIKFNNDVLFKSLLEEKFDMSNFQSSVWREGFPVEDFMKCFQQMVEHFRNHAGEGTILLKNYLMLLMMQNSKQPAELICSKSDNRYAGNTYVRMAGGLNNWLPYLQAGIKPLYVARCFHRTNAVLDDNGDMVEPANSVEELRELGSLPFSWYQRLV